MTGTEQCPAGLVTILSDYLSTQVALLAPDGTVASHSFLSSGSTEATGQAAPLSGDVVAPSNRSPSDEVVLLDRFGTNVVTWADKASASIRAQLPVGTGFESNPRDYLELADGRAYIARYGENAVPGQRPFDRGGDLLIVDTRTPAIVGSIELPRVSSEFPPRPTAIASIGTPSTGPTLAVVTLDRQALDFRTQGDSELVGVDTATDTIAWHLRLEGLQGCGRAALSPSGEQLALACTGKIDFDGNLVDPDATGIVLLDATATPPKELRRIRILDELGDPPQSDVEFGSESLLVGKTQTALRGAVNNRLFTFDLDTDTTRILREAEPDEDGLGLGIVYGSLYCAPRCSGLCLMADAGTGVVRRFDLATDLTELAPIRVGASSGLPPVGLGPF